MASRQAQAPRPPETLAFELGRALAGLLDEAVSADPLKPLRALLERAHEEDLRAERQREALRRRAAREQAEAVRADLTRAARPAREVELGAERFAVRGRIRDAASAKGLPGVRVRVLDRDSADDADLLGETLTLEGGAYRVEFGTADFKDVDRVAEVVVLVLDAAGEVLARSPVVRGAPGKTLVADLAVPGEALPERLREARSLASLREASAGLDQRRLAERLALNTARFGEPLVVATAAPAPRETAPERAASPQAPPATERTAARPPAAGSRARPARKRTPRKATTKKAAGTKRRRTTRKKPPAG